MRLSTSFFRDLLAWCAFALVPSMVLPAFAAPVSARTIAVLFDSNTEKKPEETLARLFIEAPLNALGLPVRYVDLNQTHQLENLDNSEIRGVISAFPPGTRLKNPAQLLRVWERMLEQGKKVIVFGDLGIFFDASEKALPERDRTRFLNRFGLEFSGDFATNSIDYRPVLSNRSFAVAAGSAHPSFAQAPVLRITSNQVETVMRGEDFHAQQGKESSSDGIPLIILHKTSGSISLADSAFSITSAAADTQQIRAWHINPIQFFTAALDLTEIPRADLTTAYGSRAIIALIQGSGASRITNVEKYLSPPMSSLAVLESELIRPMSNILFTISPVMAEFGAQIKGENQAARTREIFRSPNVAAATSGLSNVYQWPDDELEAKQEFDGQPAKPEYEIGKALSILKRLVSAEGARPCYVASDLSSIPASVENYLHDHDICAVVGGATRLDPLHPNIAWLEPISMPLVLGDDTNKRHPVLFPFAGERDFINDKGFPEYAYRFVNETVRRSEEPVRLTPIGVRFNLSAGASAIRLAAVQEVLNALPQVLYPISANDYADMVQDFQRIRFTSCGTDCWQILNRGKISTVKFSIPSDRWIDYSRSAGVLGSRIVHDELFIALDTDEKNPQIQFSRKRPDQLHPELLESRWAVSDVERTLEQLTFRTAGIGEGSMRWKVPWGGKLSIALSEGKNALPAPPYSLDEGIMTLQLPARPAHSPLTVRVSPARGV